MFQVVFGSDFFGFWSRMAVDHSLSLSSWANHISSIGLTQPCQKKTKNARNPWNGANLRSRLSANSHVEVLESNDATP